MPSLDVIGWVTQYKLNLLNSMTQKKPTFFYATGTAFILSIFTGQQGSFIPISDNPNLIVKGLNNKTGTFSGGKITNDPFPQLLDPLKWKAVKIGYPAAGFNMQNSINDGIIKTVKAIDALPKGTPFALGGYSQGAAVMSLVMKNHLQTHTGNLGLPDITSRMADYRAAVMFGNPCRKTDSLWGPFKSYSGGLYSVSPDAPTLTRNGGSHGCLPSSYRLTTVPNNWMEFVGGTNMAIDIINCCGDGSIGTNFSSAAGSFITAGIPTILAVLAGGLSSLAGFTSDMFDAVKETVVDLGGDGHTAYPFYPPPGYPPDGPTSYQIALEFLDMIGAQLAPAATAIPNSDLGGSLAAAGGPVKSQFKPVTQYTVPSPPPTSTRGGKISTGGVS